MSNLPPDGLPRRKEEDKAKLILETMGKQGYAAMAVGERDLALGLETLKKHAEAAKLPLVASNVVDAKGKHPFLERRIVTVDKIKVGVFAITNGNEFERAGLKLLMPGEVAQKQADALRKEGAQFVIALLHLDYTTALNLSNGLKGVDFAIQSHDSRVSGTQLVGTTLLVAGGERGRQVGKAKFSLLGKLPYFDMSDAGNAREQIGYVENNIRNVEERMKADPQNKARYEPIIANFKRRKEELKAKMDAKPPAGQRWVISDFTAMDEKIKDDPAVKKTVDAFVKKFGPTNAH